MRGWEPGELIIRGEVLGSGPGGHADPRPWWCRRAWEAIPVYVVEDNGGSDVVKDIDVLDDRVAERRSNPDLVAWIIREIGAQLADELDAGRHWWAPAWADWSPPPDWTGARLPADRHLPPCPWA